jgi:hypothetical protein
MTAIPIPISSAPGVRAEEGAGRLVNTFAVKQEAGARFPVIWYRCAGLREVLNIASHVHLRGAILVGTTLVCVLDTRVYAVTVTAGVFSATNLGAQAGTDKVTIAKNNAATPNIVMVSSDGAFNLFTGSAPTAFADADLPQPLAVAELDGYFLFCLGDGRIFASDLNAVTVSTNSFTTEQSLGGLLRGVAHKGEFWAFGSTGTGLYKDKGLSPFPLERQFQIEKGIIGTHAVAGWERGWVGELIWVGADGVVYRANGYTPEPISNDDVTRAIVQSIRDGTGATLEASVYMQGKHAFWRLTDPGNWTWDYNVTTTNWCERESFNRDDCRSSTIVRAFNMWLSGDRTTGKLFDIKDEHYVEADDALIAEWVTGAVANFPARIKIPRADFDFTVAVGDAGGEDDPQVQISWALDGGYTYGNPVLRPLGPQGESRQPVTVQRVGRTTGKGIRFKLRVSDNVHVALQGGQVPVVAQAAE